MCLTTLLCIIHTCTTSPLRVQAMWDDVADRMTELGFERGWGATAARIREQFRRLLDILQVRMGGQLFEYLAVGC